MIQPNLEEVRGLHRFQSCEPHIEGLGLQDSQVADGMRMEEAELATRCNTWLPCRKC